MAAKILGIVNITEDSFSDGGQFLSPEAAIAQARKLASEGADVLDLGAASSNPRSTSIEPQTEIARLAPVVEALRGEGHAVSVDTFSPAVQRWAIAQGVEYINDISGFPHTELYPALASSRARLIVMHSVQHGPARERIDVPPSDILPRILRFFEERLDTIEKAGIARERLIVDPGMGTFLSTDAEASFVVLRSLGRLKEAFGLPVLISVSRKLFVRGFLGRSPQEAGAATLAAELFAARQDADFIRTHDPGALKDALAVTARLEGAQSGA